MRAEVDRLTQLGPLAAYRVAAGRSRPDGRRVVFLHGFTQNAACMGPTGPILAREHDVIAVDLPGHGHSGVYSGVDLWHSAELVQQTAGTGCYVGYSMGGRVALHLALSHPSAVQALVLIGATAGIDDDDARADRAGQDLENAAKLEHLGTEAFVREWLEQPLFATLPGSARFEAERGTNDASGLAESLRNCGTGSMESLWARLDQISCPVLIISGELDLKFTELAALMAERIGTNAKAVVVPDAGHSVHLERPEACSESISAFLAEL
ncbi:MAG: alpha/beta fold hydrolase [Microthrixaceae bacterium]